MKEPRGKGIPCEVKTRKARKNYKCCWCGEEIEKGESHQHCTGHWEGDWQNWRMHTECFNVNEEEIGDGFESFTNERPNPKPKETP